MKKPNNKTGLLVCTLLLSGLYLTGCSSSSNDSPDSSTGDSPTGDVTPQPGSEQAEYEVTVVNATNNQPLSPVAVITHSDSFTAWAIGSAASVELEHLAEGGSNNQLLTSLETKDASNTSGSSAIGPGGSETINVITSATSQTFLTIVTMLVNTNDAFSGVSSLDVSGLAVGESITMPAPVYDAGTEINSESAGTIPGPADGGEGFNAARSDTIDSVRRHGGVVTKDDGLSISVLDQSHRFDNPAMIITIKRK